MSRKHSRTFLFVCLAFFTGAVLALLLFGNSRSNSAIQTLEKYPIDLSLVGQHRHDLKKVSAENAPAVDLEVKQGMMGGHFNLKIDTENFTFTPENVGEEHVPNEGHAHVFVDDVKISRAYGSWYHLPRLKPGKHIIKVTLNTNDHQEYTTAEEFILDTETVTVPGERDMDMEMGTSSRKETN